MKIDNALLEETNAIDLQFEKRGGLLPVAVQETSSGQLLMLATVNQESFEISLKTRKATFYSTSRNEIWTKGLTSGNTLKIDNIFVDCDQDALVYQVTLENGGVCHTFNKNGENRKACFYRKINWLENNLEFVEK